MANNFTVEAVDKLAKAQQEKEDNAREEARQSRGRASVLAKAQDTTAKVVLKEKEKEAKMAEEREKRILQCKIARRYEAFEWLATKVPPPNKTASITDLRETDELQKLELDMQGSKDRLVDYVVNGGLAFETLWGDGKHLVMLPENLRLNLSGISHVVKSEQFWKKAGPLLEETVIEYPAIGQMGLTMRWVHLIGATLMEVHRVNTAPPKMLEMLKKPPMAVPMAPDISVAHQ